MSNSGRLRSWIGNVPWGSVRGVGDSGIWAMVILRSNSPEDEDGFEIVGHPITLNLCPISLESLLPSLHTATQGLRGALHIATLSNPGDNLTDNHLGHISSMTQK